MLGGKVYIRPEYIDFVNPISGDNSVNYKVWSVISISEEAPYNHDGAFSYDSYQCYTIECDGFVVRNVRETYLMGLEEVRDKKIQQIIN